MRFRPALLAAALLALTSTAASAETLADAKFEPGKDIQIDDPATGGAGFYIVALPSDYDPSRPWPTIVSYHGANQKPSSWPFKAITGNMGFIVIGMEYLDPPVGKQVPVKEVANLKRILTALNDKIKIDKKLMFIGGFSQGGFQTCPNSDLTTDVWAGIIIFGAGRGGGPKNPALAGKPVLIAAGENDPYVKNAQDAVKYYTAQKSDVTWVSFEGKAHEVDTGRKELKEWLFTNGPQKQAKQILEAAKAAEKAGKIGEAHKLFAQAAATPDAGDVGAAAKTAAEAIATRADKLLADAAAAIATKKYADAVKTFLAVSREFALSTFADKAAARIKEISTDPTIQGEIAQATLDQRADAAEAVGKTAEDKKDYAAAIRVYERYLIDYAKATRLPQVKTHLDALKADKTLLAHASADDAEKACRGDFQFAEAYIKNGHPEQAVPLLQAIIAKYPTTDWATKAKARLAEIKAAGG